MSESAIRAYLKSLLQALDIGLVHDYMRWVIDNTKRFEQVFVTGGVLRGWMITRAGTEAKYLSVGEDEEIHTYVVIGVRAVDDTAASELAFNADIEAIRDAVRFDFRFGNSVEHAGPVTVRTIEHRLFGDKLCHYSELVIRVQELRS